MRNNNKGDNRHRADGEDQEIPWLFPEGTLFKLLGENGTLSLSLGIRNEEHDQPPPLGPQSAN
jgi:hypothetical protein